MVQAQDQQTRKRYDNGSLYSVACITDMDSRRSFLIFLGITAHFSIRLTPRNGTGCIAVLPASAPGKVIIDAKDPRRREALSGSRPVTGSRQTTQSAQSGPCLPPGIRLPADEAGGLGTPRGRTASPGHTGGRPPHIYLYVFQWVDRLQPPSYVPAPCTDEAKRGGLCCRAPGPPEISVTLTSLGLPPISLHNTACNIGQPCNRLSVDPVYAAPGSRAFLLVRFPRRLLRRFRIEARFVDIRPPSRLPEPAAVSRTINISRTAGLLHITLIKIRIFNTGA